jgi:hypothetical protein
VDFFFRDNCRAATACYHHVNAWRSQEIEPPFYPGSKKDVAREKRQRNQPGSILPVVTTAELLASGI